MTHLSNQTKSKKQSLPISCVNCWEGGFGFYYSVSNISLRSKNTAPLYSLVVLSEIGQFGNDCEQLFWYNIVSTFVNVVRSCLNKILLRNSSFFLFVLVVKEIQNHGHSLSFVSIGLVIFTCCYQTEASQSGAVP